jgi:hypothetical protein
MNELISRLKTPEECDQFAKNVAEKYPDLAREAHRRAVELRAATHGANSAAEREALQAVYAYEEVLSKRRGKRTHASRTWQMIKRHGIIGAVERAVNRKDVTIGYKSLIEMGMQDFAFEAVVVRYPALFSPETVKRATERMKEWERA